MYCSTCGDEREFEQPPCPDGHGPDCPERACTACGTAVLAGFPVIAASPVPAAALVTAGRSASARPTASGSPGPTRAASQRAVA